MDLNAACIAGCGFLDTATQLVKLGADVNARDLTQCTPLQNAAHGTYSALATMPLNGTQNAVTGQSANIALGIAVILRQKVSAVQMLL